MSAVMGTGSAYAAQVAQAEAWARSQVHAAEDARVLAAMVEHADESGLVAYAAVASVARACSMTRNELADVLARLYRTDRWTGCHDGLRISNHHEFNHPTEGMKR